MAQRLQVAALQECAWRDNRYFVSWRNATLNGTPLLESALTKLQVLYCAWHRSPRHPIL
jgi:hypothetical protein